MKSIYSLIVLFILAQAPVQAGQASIESKEAAKPDLVPVLASPMSSPVVVRNRGQAAVGASRLRIACGVTQLVGGPPNADCATGARYSDHETSEFDTVATVDVPPLKPRESARVTVPFWKDMTLLPEGLAYRFAVEADPDNAIEESDEDNNLARARRLREPASL
jgi:hypothetical protein